ncbi:hypothetical protein [Pseudoalteromonas tetraodonis]|uniref:hypothetical protein n=1 Tax=Pseudoalteromonas tetraodonis TaxID=43659 RepID=UPI003F5CC67D
MMNNIVRFVPQVDLTAQQNLNQFITTSRDQLTAFGQDTWGKNKWHTFKGKTRVVARFSTNLKPSDSYHFEPLGQPYLDFAKAYIRDLFTDKPLSSLARQMEAIKILEEALLLATGKADILELNGVVLEHLDRVFKSRTKNAQVRNQAGYQMQLLLNFCRDKLIAPDLPEWSNPYPKVKDLTVTLDDKGKEHRSEKMPTNEEMMMVAELFSKAPQLGVEAEYYSAIFALLMTAPSRATELTALQVDCLVWEEDKTGELKLGIRWVPAKKGKEGIKWVPSVMQDVVIAAVDRLKRISAPARKIAKFSEENPGTFMVHEGCITPAGFDHTASLSLAEFNAATSLQYKSFSKEVKWLQELNRKNQNRVTYGALGQYFYDFYTKKLPKWPFVDNAKKVKASEALFLHRENEFHLDFSPKNYSFLLPSVNQINDRFMQKESREDRTLWKKFGFTLKSGQLIKLTTHKARHWLSTLAEDGGMGELALANWAGRAKVGDNKSYDHRTEAEKANEVAKLMISEDANVLERIKNRIPVRFADIGKDLDGSAIVTELGVCEHDYAMMPCQRNGDCETCKELVCIKGFSSSLENLKKRELEVEILLNKALKDHELGAFGADRWVSNHAWRLAHIKTKIRILEDDNTPEGTPVRIPEEYDPSPIKEALRQKGFNEGIEAPEDIELSDQIFSLMEL